MKVYGYAINHEYGNTTLVSTSLAGAVIECAAWCRQNWTATARAPKIVDDQKFIDRYIEAHDEEQLDPFETDLILTVDDLSKLNVNDLRDAYINALDKAYRAHRSKRWLEEQMKALNDALPTGWTVYSDLEIAEMTDLTGGDPLHVS